MNINIKNIEYILKGDDSQMREDLQNWLQSEKDKEYDERLTKQVEGARKGWRWFFTRR